MGNFRSDNRRSEGRGRDNHFSGNRFGRRNDREEGRSFRRSERRNLPMCEAICAKCGKECMIPFKPTGDKPVYCSDCFAKQGNSQDRFSSNRRGNLIQSEISSDQFKQLNLKLDKILNILSKIEFEEDSGSEDEDEDEDLEAEEEDFDDENSEDEEENSDESEKDNSE